MPTVGRAVVAQGATFTFTPQTGGSRFSGGVTKVTVEAPQAEIADVTGLYDSTTTVVRVPTGAWTGGSITVDFLVLSNGSMNIDSMIGKRGQMTFSASGYSISRNVIVKSVSSEGSVGDVFRGTRRFIPTDYYGR
jgi:hypothetical protein